MLHCRQGRHLQTTLHNNTKETHNSVDCFSRGPLTHIANMLKEGKISEEIADFYHVSFGISREIWENRPCPEGIFAQNVSGISKSTQTTQEHLAITEKSTAEWVRARDPLPSETDQVTALAFLMDGAVSFAPLAFNHMYIDDTAACSSLDFALRLFSNEFDLGKCQYWVCRHAVETHSPQTISKSLGSKNRMI